jgi:hypothetical protein
MHSGMANQKSKGMDYANVFNPGDAFAIIYGISLPLGADLPPVSFDFDECVRILIPEHG